MGPGGERTSPVTTDFATSTQTYDPDTTENLLAAIHALRADIDSFAAQLDQHDQQLSELRALVADDGEIPIQDDIDQTFDRLQRAADAAFARPQRRWLRWLRWGR